MDTKFPNKDERKKLIQMAKSNQLKTTQGQTFILDRMMIQEQDALKDMSSKSNGVAKL
jgi:hypothetical protein